MMKREGFDTTGTAALAASEYREERDYWLNCLKEIPKKSRFTGLVSRDSSNKSAPRSLSDLETLYATINGQCYENISKVSRRSPYTEHMILTAAITALLSIYTSHRDIIVGAPIYKQETEGDFINTILPLRSKLEDNTSFKELLINVRQTVVEAIKYQNYPMETLLFQLNIPYTKGDHFPLFDTAVLLKGIHEIKYMESVTIDTFFVFEDRSESLECRFSYNPDSLDSFMAGQILNHFTLLLDNVLSNINLPLRDIDILTVQERQQILEEFNHTKREYPSKNTVDEIFSSCARRFPDKVAVAGQGQAVSYLELDRRSSQLAVVLKNKGVSLGEPVAIMPESRIDMITGILAILKCGGAYLPINPDYPLDRRLFLIKDSNAKIMLCNYQIDETLPVEILAIDDEGIYSDLNSSSDNQIELFRDPLHGADDLAYIMYTSGSTGQPKGILVKHRNVVRLVVESAFVPLDDQTRILQTGALEFDASTFEIWGVLLNGGQLILSHKDAVLDSEKLKSALIDNKVCTIWMTSPLFNRMVNIDPAIFAALSHLVVGGDTLSPVHINQIRKRYPHIRLVNGYGPTENTTFSVTHHIDKTYINAIPIGRPITNSTAYIVDHFYNLLPIGVTGELIVGGDGVARGYLNNPELTVEKFVFKTLSHSKYRENESNEPGNTLDGPLNIKDNGKERVYCTGDLARWTPDGLIEFFGRKDQQVKIRGFRIEPEEIEYAILKNPEIKDVVVVASEEENSGEKFLCAYFVPEGDVDITKLRQSLSETMPDYMVPGYFVSLDCIPLNANGKLDRKKLPSPQSGMSGEGYIAPQNNTQSRLAEIWSRVLWIDAEKIGIDDDFFELGGHSLKATILISNIHKELNVKIPLAEIFNRPTIRELAGYIQEAVEESYVSLEVAEEKEYYPLSPAQLRLFILQQLGPGITNYNVPKVAALEGSIDVNAFRKVFRALISRHESLRTSFLLIDETPVQRVHPDSDIDFEIECDAQDTDSFIRPFDLSKAPLMRVRLLNTGKDRYLLMLDMHHIITDGTSMVLFVKEFAALYGGDTLSPLKLQYKDYSQWQNSQTMKKMIHQQSEYWINRFSDELPVLSLPLDYPRPPVQSFAGHSFQIQIDVEDTARLKEIAADADATLYMTLLAIYNVFLHKITGQEDIIVGTPIAGRRHADLQRMIGMFINTLAIRNQPRPEKSFLQLLSEVRQCTLDAYENQEFQFEDLVEKVTTSRDAARNPLFDTIFALQNFDIVAGEIPETRSSGITIKGHDHKNVTAKFDFSLLGSEAAGCLIFTVEYCTALFSEGTVRRLMDYFKHLVHEIAEQPRILCSDANLMDASELEQIAVNFNRTSVLYPKDSTVHLEFERMAAEIPEADALHYRDADTRLPMTMTYSELNFKSNQLARKLRDRGVTAGSIVAIMAQRSMEMIVGLLGILKAGGCYLPIDPGFPEARKKYLLVDSQTRWLLHFGDSEPEISFAGEVISLAEESLYEGDGSNLEPITQSSNLIYVIYTSGSTGRPKGVMVENRGVLRLVKNPNFIEFKTGDKLLKTTALEFDVSAFEIWGALLNGLTLHLESREDIMEPEKLKEFIQRYQIDIMWLTAPFFNQVLQADESTFDGLGTLLVGGDTLSPPHINRLRDRLPELNVINGYGPTENTGLSTTFLIRSNYKDSIPIGNPVSNSTAYIVDANARLLPVGIIGELVVGGDGVARGYLNQPELTTERFVNRTIHKVSKPQIETRVYHTGDLARWNDKGVIEFFGRMDKQVKIRGYRIELEEIQNQILNVPHVSDAVVTIRSVGNEKSLCAYIIIDKDMDIPKLQSILSINLPGYMIPPYFVTMDALPLNPNGKVDVSKLPEPETGLVDHFIPPANETEEILLTLCAEVLGIAKEKISVNANFFKLGGHSLRAIIFGTKIHKALDVRVPLAVIFQFPTIRGLANYIDGAAFEKYSGIEAVEKKEYYPVSSVQRRLYIVQKMNKTNRSYNVPVFMSLQGDIDLQRIEDTFETLIRRHEFLRTSFHMVDEEAVQKVLEPDDVPFSIEWKEATEEELSGLLNQFVLPFDLSHAPLLRVSLVKTGENLYTLMLDIHHIVTDGTSMAMFVREFMILYNGQELPPMGLQYKDYATWQSKRAAMGDYQRQEAFWLNQFSGEIPVLNLPLDFPRPSVYSFDGSLKYIKIGEEIAPKLRALLSLEDTTLFSTFLAIYTIFLSKLTGQEDIVVGTPIAGRPHADLQSVMGMFVNTLAMRNFPASGKTFRQFLKEVKEQTLDAFENQEYNFQNLVEQILPERDPSRNPLFDTVFTLQNFESGSKELPTTSITDFKLTPMKYQNPTSKFDLTLFARDDGYRFVFRLEYNTKLFKPETIERMANDFTQVLIQVSEHPEIQIQDICLESETVESDDNFSDVEFNI